MAATAPAPEVAPAPAIECPGSRAVRDLPDLTGRLMKEGLLGEYLEYRTRYLMWRSGSSRGAEGELTRLSRRDDLSNEWWHPTPQKFDFFYTISYWVAVSSVIGSLLLTFKDTVLALEAQADLRLMASIGLAGDVMYTIACYLNYLEIINAVDTGHFRYLRVEWAALRRQRVGPESCVGSLAYLVGMLIWDIGATVELLPSPLPDLVVLLAGRTPYLIGGFFFLAGGICEVLHNSGKSPADVEWWASGFDLLADVAFAIGGVTGMFDGLGRLTSWCYAVGMALFTVAAVLFIVMWRGNGFGLTLLRQLNSSLRVGDALPGLQAQMHAVTFHLDSRGRGSQEGDGGSHSGLSVLKSRGLSTRGVFFLVVYCWLFTCCVMNAIAGVRFAEGWLHHAADMVGDVLWILIVAIVLVIHSALTSVPNQQPYRLAMLAVRGTLLLAMLKQTTILVGWMANVKFPYGPTALVA